MANRRDVVTRFAGIVQRFARLRDSGYPGDLDEMTALEFEGLLMWDMEWDGYERAAAQMKF